MQSSSAPFQVPNIYSHTAAMEGFELSKNLNDQDLN